jgi:signal transduction histidine kinase
VRIILKFTAALLLGVVLVLGVALALQMRRERDLFQSDMLADDSFIARRLASADDAVRRTQGQAAADQFIAKTDLGSSNVHVRGADAPAPQRRPLPADLASVLRTGEYGYFDDAATLHVLVPIAEGQPGFVEITEDPNQQRTYARGTIWQHMVTMAAITALCGLLALTLGAVIVGAPVGRMVAQARRIGRGDLTGRLAPRNRDELADLAREIDAMCEQLALARDRLEAESAAKIRALEQLRRAERLATVGKLASGIAHELGTPLNIVSARAKMVSTGESQGPQAREAAAIISDQAGRMTRIIRQLLDFARPRRPAREPSDLASLIRHAAMLLEPIVAVRSVSVVAQEPPSPICAAVDPAQVQQVLSNLVVNAAHASTPNSAVTLSCGIETARPPADIGGAAARFAFIRVADRGRGIPPQEMTHLFEPFFTTKDVGEGTGLGLSISSGIVREHGGWIDVQSNPGEGSVFTAYFPLGA